MLKGLSLFANVGIGETYIKEAGVDMVLANELLPERCDLYKKLHPETDVIQGDVTSSEIFEKIIKLAKEKDVDFIMATPPCQGMSSALQQKIERDIGRAKRQESDQRNYLIIKAIEAIKEISPKYGLIENVPQMLKTSILFDENKVRIIDYVVSELSEKYYINYSVLDAADYGTPQTRKRAIILLSRRDQNEWTFPEKTKKINLSEAIGHLPSLNPGESSDIPFHYAKSITISILNGCPIPQAVNRLLTMKILINHAKTTA